MILNKYNNNYELTYVGIFVVLRSTTAYKTMMHTYDIMINSKPVLISLVAFAMLAMAATTIVTQEAYATTPIQKYWI